MINDDKSFYHKAFPVSAFFVLGDKTIYYCLLSLRNIFSPYFTLNQNLELKLFCCTNRCNSDFSFIKKVGDHSVYPLGKVYSRSTCNTQYIS